MTSSAHRDSANGEQLELLSIRANDQDFAIDIMSVCEIRGWTPSTPIPHAPNYIKGMINLRGKVLPILSLAERLNLAAGQPTSSSVVVVVVVANRMVGLLVESVSDIIKIDRETIQETPSVGSSGPSSTIRGLVTLEDSIVSILSLPELLPADGRTDLAA